jgi:triosephosphate isomerase
VDLRSVSSILDAERLAVSLGAQHVNPHDNGAHTGEVSVSMLQRLGVAWVIVGHSERRTQYAMSDEIVAATLSSVVHAGLHAVLCVGESLELRTANEHEAFVAEQLRRALGGLEERYHEFVTVAYEPLWAIGTGVVATAEQVSAMTAFVRGVLTKHLVGATRVLYGGSVNAENAGSLVRESELDGFLVGGASLKAESFCAIVHAVDDCYAIKR